MQALDDLLDGVRPEALDAVLVFNEVVRDVLVHYRQVAGPEALLKQPAGGEDVAMH